jgi:hypothetical protein
MRGLVLLRAALGLLLGISDRAVLDMATAGHVVAIGRNRYDVAASVPRYCEHLRSLAGGRFGHTSDVASGTAARARRTSVARYGCRIRRRMIWARSIWKFERRWPISPKILPVNPFEKDGAGCCPAQERLLENR